MYIFTICSNNYLGQAIALGNSVNSQNPEYKFSIFLCDEKSELIDYSLIKHNIIEIGIIEPRIYELAKKYNIIELNTAVKPKIFQYIFEITGVNKAMYLDPDIFVYNSLSGLERELNTNSTLLTPHIFNSIPHDGKTPSENTFLNYGIYNLGFLALKRDDNTKQLLNWWKNITYNICFIQPANGIFVDQLPMNMAPLFFSGVKIITDVGYNMAPWNLHERRLEQTNNEYIVNGNTTLKFYHFSSFNFDSLELPNHYNRYNLAERSDLLVIYQNYQNELIQCKFQMYKTVPCVFVKIRNQEISATQKLLWEEKSLLQKTVSLAKKYAPSRLKQILK